MWKQFRVLQGDYARLWKLVDILGIFCVLPVRKSIIKPIQAEVFVESWYKIRRLRPFSCLCTKSILKNVIDFILCDIEVVILSGYGYFSSVSFHIFLSPTMFRSRIKHDQRDCQLDPQKRKRKRERILRCLASQKSIEISKCTEQNPRHGVEARGYQQWIALCPSERITVESGDRREKHRDYVSQDAVAVKLYVGTLIEYFVSVHVHVHESVQLERYVHDGDRPIDAISRIAHDCTQSVKRGRHVENRMILNVPSYVAT